MKKLLAYILAFTALTIQVSATAYAADCSTAAMDAILTGGTECITEDESNSRIITIVEEPFGSDFKFEDDPTFKARTCYRNTLVCTERNEDGKIKGQISETRLKRECLGGSLGGDQVLYCEEVLVILSTGGTTMIEGYISMVYTWGASIVGIIAVLVIVISGIQLAISGGDTSAVDSAKDRILKSLAGLALLFLSGVLLYTINPNFFTAPTPTEETQEGSSGGGTGSGGGAQE